MGFDFMFSIFPILFFVVFALIAFVVVFIIVKGIGEWNNNNHSPKLDVSATCVTKRTNVTHSHNQTTSMSTADTTYYATFEVDSGDRIEFHISPTEYGQLAEGDKGILHFQGTRYLGFNRNYGDTEW